MRDAHVEALMQRIETLAYENRQKDLRISDLLHIIEMGQRFGSLSSFDTERLERVQREYQ